MAAFSDDKVYKKACEELISYWYENKIYSFDTKIDGCRFVFDAPPPTISGDLHMGHVFSYCHADIISRFRRMFSSQNGSVFYSLGFDANGLPTERLVEKLENERINDSNKESMRAKHEHCVKEFSNKFVNLFKTIGVSYDYSLSYNTMDFRSSLVAQWSFVDLLQKGEIYSSNSPTLWDVVDKTSVAQAEVCDSTKQLEMHYINFYDAKGEPHVVATTRPELLISCVAVLHHPDDGRFKSLAKYLHSPLFNVRVPVIADDLVSKDKGTGLVMCCTFGDELDLKWFERHKGEFGWNFDRVSISEDGSIHFSKVLQEVKSLICSVSGQKVIADDEVHSLDGLSIKKARVAILEKLRNCNHWIKSESIASVVKCAERSGSPLEILPVRQWYMHTVKNSDLVLKSAGKIYWRPFSMKQKLEDWINSLRWDWCISRNRHFGVGFPVWWIKNSNNCDLRAFLVAKISQLPANLHDAPPGCEIIRIDDEQSLVCSINDKIEFMENCYVDENKSVRKCTSEEVEYFQGSVVCEPDKRVMDTWFVSSMTPVINAAIECNSSCDIGELVKKSSLYPANARLQSHEIIRTWAYYAILKSEIHFGIPPWKTIIISGWCIAEDRQKMSKSMGNVIDPRVLIEEMGSDGIRYWASLAALGRDVTTSKDVMNQGKRLVNKLYNATIFTQTFIKKNPEIRSLKETLYPIDAWLLGQLDVLLQNATSLLLRYEFAEALRSIESFFWKIFCDRYLEFVKYRVYGDRDDINVSEHERLSGIFSLSIAMENLLKLFAPFVPFITDYLFKDVLKMGNSIHAGCNWPKSIDYFSWIVKREDAWWGNAVSAISGLVRGHRSRNSLPMCSRIALCELKLYGKISRSDFKPIERDILFINFIDKIDVDVAEFGTGRSNFDLTTTDCESFTGPSGEVIMCKVKFTVQIS